MKRTNKIELMALATLAISLLGAVNGCQQRSAVVKTASTQPSPTPSPTPPPSPGAPELPRVFLDTSYRAPTGQTITVNAGGNLQNALNQAQPGDLIQLPAGATFTGKCVLPNKTGADWMIIRSSAADAHRASPR